MNWRHKGDVITAIDNCLFIFVNQIEKLEEGTPPLLRVFYKKTDDPQEFSIDVNTVSIVNHL